MTIRWSSRCARLGEPVYVLESNPTVERIARLIFEKGHELGVDIIAVPRVGDSDLGSDLLDRRDRRARRVDRPRRHAARRLA